MLHKSCEYASNTKIRLFVNIQYDQILQSLKPIFTLVASNKGHEINPIFITTINELFGEYDLNDLKMDVYKTISDSEKQ